MKIVFDMDNTLVDELGSGLRPGIRDLLEGLKKEGHRLVLWTNSRRERGRQVIVDCGLRGLFESYIFREDYDPDGKGVRKDIRKIGGDILVDDDPEEIGFVRSIKKDGFLISPYRKNSKPDPRELERLKNVIKKIR